jgi:hypothetical protein
VELLKRLPGARRAASGLEWRIWKRLPVVLLVGTAALALVMLALWWMAPSGGGAETAMSWMRIYQLAGLLLLHWTLVLTVAIGCVVVMVMKGPAYVADPYPPQGREGPG